MLAPIAYLAMPGPMEMLIIGGIALLLFGNRLPGAMRSLGRGVVEFKKGLSDVQDEMNQVGGPKDPPKSE